MTDNTELLTRIAESLERIADALETNNKPTNKKTVEIRETRQLMQDVVSHYKNSSIDVKIGSVLDSFMFRDTIARIKNIQNNRYSKGRIHKCIKKLEECQFISKQGDAILVLDIGKDWSEL